MAKRGRQSRKRPKLYKKGKGPRLVDTKGHKTTTKIGKRLYNREYMRMKRAAEKHRTHRKRRRSK